MKKNQSKSKSFNPEDLSLFPTKCGVYIMKNASGKILYIGKAKNIRSRLRTYYSTTGDGRLSVEYFLPRVTDIETIITNNEKEAFLLENILIKKRKPVYNIRLRDDKTYISLRIDTRKKYPRLEWVRRRKKDGALYFGPYSSTIAVRKTVRFLEKIFPLRTCSDSVMKNRTRPCIRHQINRCLAPCTKHIPREEYMNMVNGVVLYLRGNMKELIRRMTEKMNGHSEAMRYEEAARLRDQIEALEATVERQIIADERSRDIDIIGHHIAEGKCCMMIFQYRMGMMAGTRSYFFDAADQSVTQIYYSFFGQYYDKDKFIPPIILTGTIPEETELLQEWLTDLRGSGVRIYVPQRGRKKSYLNIAMENARDKLQRKLEGERDMSLVLQTLQRKLHLPEAPMHIDAFDISNIQGRLSVGSMVVFKDGKPDKSLYRHFKIRTVTGSDDFAMMHEVIKRRYKRVKEENLELPDLILIDGGKGQLNAALRALEELDLGGLSAAGIAKSRLKEDKSRKDEKKMTPERIFLPGRKNPVILKPGSPALYLIQRVRDEAHRFAITHHKKRRSKALTRSNLDDIPGIGPKRKKALLRKLGSLKAIRKASLEKLEKVPGMSKKSAKAVWDFFNHGKKQHLK